MILAVDMEICLLPSRDMILEIESDRRNLRVRKASRYAIFAKKFYVVDFYGCLVSCRLKEERGFAKV